MSDKWSRKRHCMRGDNANRVQLCMRYDALLCIQDNSPSYEECVLLLTRTLCQWKHPLEGIHCKTSGVIFTLIIRYLYTV